MNEFIGQRAVGNNNETDHDLTSLRRGTRMTQSRHCQFPKAGN
jgi:hypothetical protein